MKVFAGFITDRGNYREKNQDRATCRLKRSKKGLLAVGCVCDGIGSFARSEVASEMMIAGIDRWFEGIEDYFPDRITEETLLEDLELTIRELNELVFSYYMQGGEQIGCTMSLFLLVNEKYHAFHVGDSRICCVRDSIEQITRDEVSMVESHGKVKSRLANYIGKKKELWMNKFSGTVREKDIYLLGSDGLFKRLEYEDVRAAAKKIRNDKSARKASEKLLKRVLERGERDNISCVLLRVESL